MTQVKQTRVTRGWRGCLLCRLRRKRCKPPLSDGPCVVCEKLRLHCPKGYGQEKPHWLDARAEAKVMKLIRPWTMGRFYQRNGVQSPPDVHELFSQIEHNFFHEAQPAEQVVVSHPASDHISGQGSGINLPPQLSPLPFPDNLIPGDDSYGTDGQSGVTDLQHFELGALDVAGPPRSQQRSGLDANGKYHLHGEAHRSWDAPASSSQYHRADSLQPPAEQYIRQRSSEAASALGRIRPTAPHHPNHPMLYADSHSPLAPSIPFSQFARPDTLRGRRQGDCIPGGPPGPTLTVFETSNGPQIMTGWNQPCSPTTSTLTPHPHSSLSRFMYEHPNCPAHPSKSYEEGPPRPTQANQSRHQEKRYFMEQSQRRPL
ncbi:uncharacterized protein EI90DRAFT_3066886 [Cantharellus anzutake]|uniref:uncharacterized protein n=1 Tax=Cantharellus anzutake TaxID=1750568 RepID=UPI0019087AEC|nr:uncharacterized protein EI90DRAFT_3066886 [Cantharellus anzutake]KAF8327750.1 hypothetical protein EI90DRAFT_3066886 [Cantharellus anzutake]